MTHNQNDSLVKSAYVLDQTRKANVFSTLIIIIFGLIGHTLTIYLFSKKIFRSNSSNVYLLCLAIIDGSFLILHFFEDSLRTFIDIYDIDNSIEIIRLITRFFKRINLTDNYDLSCRLINYLRYTLRFISAYIIVAFTIQRAVLVFFPLSEKFKTKKSAWLTVIVITVISLPLNLWVLFFFEINFSDKSQYCDVRKVWKSSYFRFTVAYISFIMLVPIVTIFICNILIIYKTEKADIKRKKLQMKTENKKNNNTKSSKNASRSKHTNNIELRSVNSRLTVNRDFEQASSNDSFKSSTSPSNQNIEKSLNNYRLKIYYKSSNQIASKMSNKLNNSNVITRSLLFVSFSYAILNLPYFISWSVFFYQIAFIEIDSVKRNYSFTALQISEVFYILNYSIYFYISFTFGSAFRSQFKSAILNNRTNKSQATIQFYAEEVKQFVSDY